MCISFVNCVVNSKCNYPLQNWSNHSSIIFTDQIAYEAVGIENGLIDDSKITIIPGNVTKNSIRFSTKFDPNNCLDVNYLTIDLGQIMTVKGLEYRSNVPFSGGMHISSGMHKDENGNFIYMLLGKSVRGGEKPKEYRVSYWFKRVLQIFHDLKNVVNYSLELLIIISILFSLL